MLALIGFIDGAKVVTEQLLERSLSRCRNSMSTSGEVEAQHHNRERVRYVIIIKANRFEAIVEAVENLGVSAIIEYPRIQIDRCDDQNGNAQTKCPFFSFGVAAIRAEDPRSRRKVRLLLLVARSRGHRAVAASEMRDLVMKHPSNGRSKELVGDMKI